MLPSVAISFKAQMASSFTGRVIAMWRYGQMTYARSPQNSINETAPGARN